MNLKKLHFEIKDVNTWERREYFEYYFQDIPCTYSMTTNIDITNLITKNFKLYPTMLYLLTLIVNRYEEFRTSTDNEGNVGVFDEINPCYTIFHQNNHSFSNLWSEYNSDLKTFLINYNNDIKAFGDIYKMQAKPNQPANCFSVSMLPWNSFIGFNLNLEKGYKYLLPIFTLGKFYEENNKILLPIAIQVHHAVCDGFHLCRFIDDLQKEIKYSVL